jgi:GT2 family glycosyltransferase
MNSSPLVSVIIPHLNQTGDLAACLNSLAVQSLDRAQFEIIVVDNGSSALPQPIVDAHPGTRLLQEPTPGPGPARNTGVAAACGEIVAFIDADCRAHPNWLEAALRAVRSSPDRTIFGGDVRIWRDDQTRYTAIEAYESVFAYLQKMYIEQHGFSGTGNLMARRADFAAIGPFSGIQMAEDIEWGQRARAAGFAIKYVPDMIVYHPGRHSLRELFTKWDRHLQHYVNMAREKPYWQIRWLARAAGVLASPVVAWTKLVTTDRLEGLVPRLKAFGVLVAVRAYRAYRMITLLPAQKGVVWNRQAPVGLIDSE